MLLLGVDEAGKGPVVGSMFVAGIVVEAEKLFDLAAIGVRDSKQLDAVKRERISEKILKMATEYYILEVSPQVIDELRQVMTMNEIMVRCHARVVHRLHADKAFLDAADVNEERFAKRVKNASSTRMQLLAEHKADQKHLVVSAASIIAKVRRDESIRQLEESINCRIGSGYPNDPQTIEFLEEWISAKRSLPPFVRSTWATAQRLKANLI
ncbi:MAG: ribonuclease HII [Methanotrichaceae archaeon]|nr:ribonuclease HII [Methanotrichaceae archaeon]